MSGVGLRPCSEHAGRLLGTCRQGPWAPRGAGGRCPQCSFPYGHQQEDSLPLRVPPPALQPRPSAPAGQTLCRSYFRGPLSASGDPPWGDCWHDQRRTIWKLFTMQQRKGRHRVGRHPRPNTQILLCGPWGPGLQNERRTPPECPGLTPGRAPPSPDAYVGAQEPSPGAGQGGGVRRAQARPSASG